MSAIDPIFSRAQTASSFIAFANDQNNGEFDGRKTIFLAAYHEAAFSWSRILSGLILARAVCPVAAGIIATPGWFRLERDADTEVPLCTMGYLCSADVFEYRKFDR